MLGKNNLITVKESCLPAHSGGEAARVEPALPWQAISLSCGAPRAAPAPLGRH